MPATPAPRRLHRLVVARRNPPGRGLSLGLGIERPTPAGLLARGSGLDARLPRLSQWLSGSKSGRCIALAAYSCRDSRGFGAPSGAPTAFPIKPSRAPVRSCAEQAPHSPPIAEWRRLAIGFARIRAGCGLRSEEHTSELQSLIRN